MKKEKYINLHLFAIKSIFKLPISTPHYERHSWIGEISTELQNKFIKLRAPIPLSAAVLALSPERQPSPLCAVRAPSPTSAVPAPSPERQHSALCAVRALSPSIAAVPAPSDSLRPLRLPSPKPLAAVPAPSPERQPSALCAVRALSPSPPSQPRAPSDSPPPQPPSEVKDLIKLVPFKYYLANYKMGNKTKATSDDKRFNVKWTEHWDDVFVEALLHQQSMGNRVDKVFTTAAYNNIVKELRDKLGEPFQKDHLKNRLKTIKHHFKECHYLFSGIDDFSWSPETKLWTAEPEVWKLLTKARPDARKWMFTPIPNYDKLLMLFENEMAGGFTIAKEDLNQCGDLNCDDRDLLQNDVSLALEDLNGTADTLPTSEETDSQIEVQAPPSQSASSSKGKKRKAVRNVDFGREFASVREAIKDVAAAIREGNTIAERGRPRVYSEEEVFREIVRIGVDSQLRFRAYTFLIASAARVRAFFGCPFEERKEFLLQMMYSPQEC